MTKNIYITLLTIILLSTVSCKIDENPPYSLKFVHIMHHEASEVTVSSKANSVSTYNVYLSSQKTTNSVNVTYEITAGTGLKENIDYKILTKGNTLNFLPGIYDMPIRIQWLSNPIDNSKDNTLKITLLSADEGFNVGLPGPNKHQSELIITKI